MKAHNDPASSLHSFGGLFVFGLAALFAVLSMLLVVTGTQAYRNVVQTADGNSQARSVMSYVANKVRSADAAGAVRVQDREGTQSLVLSQDLDGEEYETRIYWYDGALWEQFVPGEFEFLPEDGERLISVPACAFELARENLLQVTVTLDSGETITSHTALRASAGDRGEPAYAE